MAIDKDLESAKKDSMDKMTVDDWSSELGELDFEDPKVGGRKPAHPARKIVTAGMKSLADGAGVAAHEELSRRFPKTNALAGELTQTFSEFNDMRKELAAGLQPTLISLETSAGRLLPQAKRLIPKKLYAKIDKKLSDRKRARDDAARWASGRAKSDIENESITNELGSVFGQASADQLEYMEASQAEARQTNLLNQALASTRNKRLENRLAELNVSSKYVAMFAKTTYTAYLKKSLELKFRHLFVAKDTLSAVTALARVTEDNLKIIGQNTALPDVAKITKYERMREKLLESTYGNWGQRLADYVSTFRQKLFKNVKEKFNTQIAGVASGFAQGASALADMQDMKNNMEGMEGAEEIPGVGGIVGRLIAQGMGRVVGTAATRKAADFVQPIMSDVESSIGDVKSNTLIKLANWRRKAAGSPGMMGILADLLPAFETPSTGTNKLLTNGTDAAVFDNITRHSVVEIIPGWLGKIHKELAELKTGKPQEEEVFDYYSRSFVKSSAMKESMFNRILGTAEQRSTSIQSALGTIQAGYERSVTEDKRLNFSALKDDFSKLIVNMALGMYSIDIPAIGEYTSSENYLDGTGYIKAITKGLKNPKDTLKVLYDSCFRNGQIDKRVVNRIQESINRQMNRDVYKNELPIFAEARGMRRFMTDIIDDMDRLHLDPIAEQMIRRDNTTFDRGVADTAEWTKRDLEHSDKVRADFYEQTEGVRNFYNRSRARFRLAKRKGKVIAKDARDRVVNSEAYQSAKTQTSEFINDATNRVVDSDAYKSTKSHVMPWATRAKKFYDDNLSADSRKNAALESVAKLQEQVEAKKAARDNAYNDYMADPSEATRNAYNKATRQLKAAEDVLNKRLRETSPVATNTTAASAATVNKPIAAAAKATYSPIIMPVVQPGTFTDYNEFLAATLGMSADELKKLKVVPNEFTKFKSKPFRADKTSASILPDADAAIPGKSSGLSPAIPSVNVTTDELGITVKTWKDEWNEALDAQAEWMTSISEQFNTLLTLAANQSGFGGAKRHGPLTVRGLFKGIGKGLWKGAKFTGGIYSKTYGGAIGGAFKLANTVASGVFGNGGSPYQDIYLKDNVDFGKPLLSAKQQARAPGVLFADTKKRVEKSSDIDRPVIDAKTGQVLISEEDLTHGLVTMSNRPINRLMQSGFYLARGAMKGAGKLAGGYFGMYGSAIKGIGMAVKGVGYALGGRPEDRPFVNIYLKDQVDPGKPLLSRRKQEKGIKFKDGSQVQRSEDIIEPVFDPESNEVLITDEDLKHGLVNVDNKPLGTGYTGGRGILRKLISTGADITKMLTKGGTGILGVYGAMYKKLFEVGANGVNAVFSLISPKHRYKGITDRLDKIYELLRDRLPKRIAGDSDNDGDRDGSYEDIMQQRKEARAKRAAAGGGAGLGVGYNNADNDSEDSKGNEEGKGGWSTPGLLTLGVGGYALGKVGSKVYKGIRSRAMAKGGWSKTSKFSKGLAARAKVLANTSSKVSGAYGKGSLLGKLAGGKATSIKAGKMVVGPEALKTYGKGSWKGIKAIGKGIAKAWKAAPGGTRGKIAATVAATGAGIWALTRGENGESQMEQVDPATAAQRAANGEQLIDSNGLPITKPTEVEPTALEDTVTTAEMGYLGGLGAIKGSAKAAQWLKYAGAASKLGAIGTKVGKVAPWLAVVDGGVGAIDGMTMTGERRKAWEEKALERERLRKDPNVSGWKKTWEDIKFLADTGEQTRTIVGAGRMAGETIMLNAQNAIRSKKLNNALWETKRKRHLKLASELGNSSEGGRRILELDSKFVLTAPNSKEGFALSSAIEQVYSQFKKVTDVPKSASPELTNNETTDLSVDKSAILEKNPSPQATPNKPRISNADRQATASADANATLAALKKELDQRQSSQSDVSVKTAADLAQLVALLKSAFGEYGLKVERLPELIDANKAAVNKEQPPVVVQNIATQLNQGSEQETAGIDLRKK